MDVSITYGFYHNNSLINFEANVNVSPEYYFDLKNLLKVKKVKDYSLSRVGLQNRDGGYVMVNNFDKPEIAYSFGISNDVSWDAVMADLGYKIFMYDHTIEKLPYNRAEFNWKKQGIAGINSDNGILNTLEYYININKHNNKKNMILKIDVEGAEWDFLETVSYETLKQFDQIVFELHNLTKPGSGKIINLLNKLNKTHQLIHLHGNNSGYIVKLGNTVFCDVIEVTYANKDVYSFREYKDFCIPTSLDAPNDIGRKDVFIGKWNEPLIIE